MMKKTQIIGFFFILIFLLGVLSGYAQNPKATYGAIALTNARIVTVTNGIIEKGTLVIERGLITAVGASVKMPSEIKVIDCTGLSVYPGMIEGGSNLGLREIGSDPMTRDYDEIGDVVPQLKALHAVNPSSVHIPVTRVSGVTTLLCLPSGGLFSGTASLINLFGYTGDQMDLGFEGVVLQFPSVEYNDKMDAKSRKELEKANKKELERLEAVWDKVKQYHELDSSSSGKSAYYPEMEALLPVYRGETFLLIEVNRSDDIIKALGWVKDHHLRKVIFTGVAEGWRVASQIAEAEIPVIVGPVLLLPTRTYDRFDRGYTNAAILHQAGVRFALRSHETENARNLPYHAGVAASYGLGKEEALKAVTIYPAQIFGVSNKLGSLEVGKSATLFVCDGDPFEPKTQVKYVFIDGYNIPMETRQTQLYEEYLNRVPGVEK